MYNYSKLRGKIREKLSSEKTLAFDLRMSTANLSYKLNGKLSWTQDQILQTANILSIPLEQIGEYFFTVKQDENN